MIVNIEVFTGVTILPSPAPDNWTGHTEPAVFTPDGDGLTGTVSWGPSLGVEHGDDGIVCGYPDVSNLPDGAEIESIELLLDGGGTSTFPLLAQIATLGSGADGTVTVTAGPGRYGQVSNAQVVLAATSSANMSAAYVNGPLIVTLGTDGAGVADPVKNTATLVAAAISLLADTSAVASGTGSTAMSVQGAQAFSAGYGFAQASGSFSTPGTLLGIPSTYPGPPFSNFRAVTPLTSPWQQWATWTGSNASPKPTTHREAHVADTGALLGAGTTKADLAASLVGFRYLIMGAPQDGTFTGEGSVTVTRFTLRITFYVSSITFAVDAGQAQIATGPLPSTVDLLAVLSGDTDGDLTYEWTLESGPDMATIESPNDLATTITFDTYAPGDYRFKITAIIVHTDTGVSFTVDDTVVITIRTPVAPTVTSGIVRLGVYDD